MIDGHAPAARAPWRAAMLLAGSLAVGLAAGAAWHWWPHQAVESGPASPIEWNAVQAVPRRALTPDEVAWEKRGEDAAVIASPDGARQSTGRGATADDAGLPRGAAARNDDGTAQSAVTSRLYVIDGDTFGIGSERIRIAGIDAPETHPSRCPREAELGNAATQQLKALLGSGTLTISGTGHDRYGRELRSVKVNGEDVGEAMIAQGLARRYAGGKRGGWCG